MKPLALLRVFLLLLLSSFLSCEKNEVVVTDGSGTNIPSYVSLLNAFSYSINAQRLTYTHVIPLTFNRNRLQTAAAVSNVGQGRAIFAILDQANAVIHADTFRLPGTYRTLMVTGLPGSISITFEDFTGSIQYTLVGDTAIGGFNLTDFPNSQGSRWTYFVYDSLAQRSDTLVVTVGGQTILPGNIPATIWQFAYLTRTDTMFVVVAGDTLRFYRYPNYSFGEVNFLFPLFLGKGWMFLFGDTNTVVQVGPLITPGGFFSVTYLVEKLWTFPNDYGVLRAWLVPRVGIAKLHRRGVSFGQANVTWELLSYHVQ
ncbi:MAG: hypothetical protein HW412_2514 [Bacteroidetes bacterium]|nr:hypothetical protein [Bacteroidota bacterium]